MRYRTPTSSDDTIDPRDLTRRLEELRELKADLIAEAEAELVDTEGLAEGDIARLRSKAVDPLDEDDAAELKTLEDIENDLPSDETLIRESYFETYARDMAESCEARDAFDRWPFNCIDWKQAAEELQTDYSSLEFDGVTFYYRS